jgi:hypothetical protein
MELEEKKTPRPDAWVQFTFHAAQRLSVLKLAFTIGTVLLLGAAYFYSASAPAWLVAGLGGFLAIAGFLFGLLDRGYHVLLRNCEGALSPVGASRLPARLESVAVTGLYALITLAGLGFTVLPFIRPLPPVPAAGPLSRSFLSPQSRQEPPGYPPPVTKPVPNYYFPTRPSGNRAMTPPPRPYLPQRPNLPPGVPAPNAAAPNRPVQPPQTPAAPAAQ